jgi:hypothetical protein
MPEPTPDKVVTQAETTQDERTMAVLAHVLQLVGGWIAPLIIFFAKRQSRFGSLAASTFPRAGFPGAQSIPDDVLGCRFSPGISERARWQ